MNPQLMEADKDVSLRLHCDYDPYVFVDTCSGICQISRQRGLQNQTTNMKTDGYNTVDAL